MNWRRNADFIPLMLIVRGHQKYRLVSSLREIAEALLSGWPLDDGEEYMAAVKACLDAIQGNLTAQEARGALIRAAAEAGVPVITVVPTNSETESNINRSHC